MTKDQANDAGSDLPSMTPEAQEFLERSIVDFRNSVIELARRATIVQPGSASEITAREVHTALDQVGFTLDKASAVNQVRLSKTRFRRLLRSIVAASSVLAVLAVIALTLLNLGVDRADKLASVVGAMVATIGLIASFYAMRLSKEASSLGSEEEKPAVARASRASKEAQVIMAWARLEQAMRQQFDDPTDNLRLSLTRLIQRYAAQAKLSPAEVSELRHALRVRNEVTHSLDSSIDEPSLDRVLSLIRYHIARVQDQE